MEAHWGLDSGRAVTPPARPAPQERSEFTSRDHLNMLGAHVPVIPGWRRLETDHSMKTLLGDSVSISIAHGRKKLLKKVHCSSTVVLIF